MIRWSCPILAIGALFAVLALVACGEDKPAPDPGGGNGGGEQSSSDGADGDLVAKGKELFATKGCQGCHSLDGSARVGPTFAGLYGSQETIQRETAEETVKVDDAYLKTAIQEPAADIVKGFMAGQMPKVPITDDETEALIALIKSVGEGGSAVAGTGGDAGGALPDAGKKVVQTKGCIGCHSLDGSARVGPSFYGLWGSEQTVMTDGTERTVTVDEDYVRRSILKPAADTVRPYTQGLMPELGLNDEEIDAVVNLLQALEVKATAGVTNVEESGPPITSAEMVEASDIYFNRCGGCHGMLRKGATGPALLPDERTLDLGTAGVRTFITHGTPKGMPSWKDNLTDRQIDLLARFLQHDPPPPPEMSLEQMKSTWKVFVQPEDRPDAPHHENWENMFGVVLRDAGQVAIFDGDTYELINIVETGFAVHILRSTATGRYFVSVGRDGKVTLIDLWMEKPDKVAEVKGCYEARSVESSKYHGPEGDYRDKYLVLGGYWPPSLIIMDGQTLEPIKVMSTSSYTYDTYEFLREARVAAIVASEHNPEWVVNIKETGYVWIVDYTDISNLKVSTIEAERFLHDGGWESQKRYVMMAANARNTISVVDTIEHKLVANVEVDATPHPGRGANWVHPEHGPVWATGHLGSNTVAMIGTDPEGHPDKAWTVVDRITLPGDGGGNLFIKTHPESQHLWVDRPLHPELYRHIYVVDRDTLEVIKDIELPEEYPGRAVHMEYDAEGKEVWISAWSAADQKSAILIYDDETLELKKEITGDWLITPTGHWNVTNTRLDRY